VGSRDGVAPMIHAIGVLLSLLILLAMYWKGDL
jgi:hypothetical protein